MPAMKPAGTALLPGRTPSLRFGGGAYPFDVVRLPAPSACTASSFLWLAEHHSDLVGAGLAGDEASRNDTAAWPGAIAAVRRGGLIQSMWRGCRPLPPLRRPTFFLEKVVKTARSHIRPCASLRVPSLRRLSGPRGLRLAAQVYISRLRLTPKVLRTAPTGTSARPPEVAKLQAAPVLTHLRKRSWVATG